MSFFKKTKNTNSKRILNFFSEFLRKIKLYCQINKGFTKVRDFFNQLHDSLKN